MTYNLMYKDYGRWVKSVLTFVSKKAAVFHAECLGCDPKGYRVIPKLKGKK